MRFMTMLALALCAGAVSPAAAQKQTQINVPADAGWKHTASGVTLPPVLAGYARGTIADSSGSGLDVMAQYGEGGGIAVTLYLFRPSIMSAAMWFDRSETQILLRRDVYGLVTPAGETRAFAAPNAGAATALQRVYAPGSGDYKSTGLVMIPVGDWLVAVRASANALDPAALDAKLREIVAGIGWPDTIAEAPLAAPVAACTDSLPYDRKAKPKKPDMTQALLGAALFAAADKEPRPGEGDAAKKLPPTVWCREGAPTSAYGVYRASGAQNAYVLAAGDAGITVSVAPAFALEDKNPGYSLSVGTLDRNLIYPNFDKLPLPQAAFDAINRLNPVSSFRRGTNEMTINVNK